MNIIFFLKFKKESMEFENFLFLTFMVNKMKICIVTEFFIPHYFGGGERRFYQLAKKLVERGVQVDLICMKIKDVPDYENIDGINVHHIGPTIENPPARSIFDFIRYLGSVISWLLKNSYDIIDAQSYSPLLSSTIASKIKKTPILGTIYDTSSSGSDQWMNHSFLANTLEKFLVNLPFDKIITISKSTEKSLTDDFGVSKDKIELIYIGVDTQKYDAIDTIEKVCDKIIFVGRLIPHKHVDHLVESFEEILKSIPNARLVIVGRGDEKKNIIDLVSSKSLDDYVSFKENLSDEDLITQIKESEVLVLPSTREGFGMVLAEANYCEVPVVTYASGGTLDVVEDGYNGFLVEPGNIPKLTEKIMLLLNDKQLQKQMGTNGRIKVETQFNWDKIVDEYLKVIDDL